MVNFEHWWDHTKDYKIGICCFSVKYIALKRKSKDWLTHNQYNWETCQSVDCCFSELVNPTKHVGLIIHRRNYFHLIKCNLFSPWYNWNITHLALNYNHSLKHTRTCPQWQIYVQKYTLKKLTCKKWKQTLKLEWKRGIVTCEIMVMVFNVTFNNISVIWWRSVSLVEETRVPGRKSPTCHKSLTTLSHNVVWNTPCHE